MDENVLFSVVIPTFNREKLLDRAIKSVLKQSFKNFELIVVDDGSTDKTSLLLEKYSDDLTIIKNEKVKGVSAARNIGAKKAQGKWLCFLDSDDEWVSSKLKLQFDYLNLNPEFKIVYTDELWIKDGVQIKKLEKQKKIGGDIFLESIDQCLIGASSVCLEKELFFEMRMFREDFPVCEDYDLWLKISSLYTVGLIKEELVIKHAGHGDQLSFKYPDMNYYRIKSLDWIFQHRDLTEASKEKVIAFIVRKGSSLLKGYQKYSKFKKLKEIEQILVNYL